MSGAPTIFSTDNLRELDEHLSKLGQSAAWPWPETGGELLAAVQLAFGGAPTLEQVNALVKKTSPLEYVVTRAGRVLAPESTIITAYTIASRFGPEAILHLVLLALVYSQFYRGTFGALQRQSMFRRALRVAWWTQTIVNRGHIEVPGAFCAGLLSELGRVTLVDIINLWRRDLQLLLTNETTQIIEDIADRYHAAINAGLARRFQDVPLAAALLGAGEEPQPQAAGVLRAICQAARQLAPPLTSRAQRNGERYRMATQALMGLSSHVMFSYLELIADSLGELLAQMSAETELLEKAIAGE